MRSDKTECRKNETLRGINKFLERVFQALLGRTKIHFLFLQFSCQKLFLSGYDLRFRGIGKDL